MSSISYARRIFCGVRPKGTAEPPNRVVMIGSFDSPGISSGATFNVLVKTALSIARGSSRSMPVLATAALRETRRGLRVIYVVAWPEAVRFVNWWARFALLVASSEECDHFSVIRPGRGARDERVTRREAEFSPQRAV